MSKRQKLILASQSPRRRFLMKKMGLVFDVIPSNFDEYFDDNRDVVEVVEELGLGKALDVANQFPDALVLGSDLIIVLDGKQLGKPETEEEAKQMLRNFSRRTHDLIASVAVVCLGSGVRRIGSETARVTFDELSEEFIAEYVATGTTYDKAGGYAIQHPMLSPHVAKIEGRIDTVIGLPTNLVAQYLSECGIGASPLELTDRQLLTEEGFFE